MNKLKTVIFKLRNKFLLLVLFSLAITVNGQEDSQKGQSPSDSIKKQDTVPSPSKPIVLERTKKYMLGGVSVSGNETISEQSILIFSGLNPGQKIKIPGDKLSSAIKKLWVLNYFQM